MAGHLRYFLLYLKEMFHLNPKSGAILSLIILFVGQDCYSQGRSVTFFTYGLRAYG